jgi:hypothetical protein
VVDLIGAACCFGAWCPPVRVCYYVRRWGYITTAFAGLIGGQPVVHQMLRLGLLLFSLGVPLLRCEQSSRVAKNGLLFLTPRFAVSAGAGF